MKDNMIMKEVEEKVTKDLQAAEVLNIAEDNKFGIKKGDIVVINFNRLKKFDMWSEGTDTEDIEFNVKNAIFGMSNYEIFGVKNQG
jgi:predicted xylose isomerase-like sugar epimerase